MGGGVNDYLDRSALVPGWAEGCVQGLKTLSDHFQELGAGSKLHPDRNQQPMTDETVGAVGGLTREAGWR